MRGRYEPDTIIARAGRPLRLTFRREETAPCSERVVFPAFGKSATLPPFRDVTVELAAAEPGEYDFTCQLGMLHGRILVRPSRRVNLAARLPWRGRSQRQVSHTDVGIGGQR